MLNSGSDNVTTFSKFILYFLLVAISAPLVEELLFRAIFFKRMSRYFSTVISMIVSSLIFGFLHIELAVIGAIMFATSNCILYIKYKNILIPILTHFTNNLISVLPQMNFSSNSPILMTKDIAISALSIGFILFLFGMFLFIKFVLLNKNYLKYNF
ncbi:MAG: CPBP family intramembrane glutamic endopeptidase, partial [Peptostreptococcaceae bacterium]|nr:CPBP family intramembrane glutamic endopeptidase [Peptostreptococcaceae bacterium]